MANIIENQHVSRRRKSTPLHTVNHKPAVYRFIQQIRQRPAQARRGYVRDSCPAPRFNNFIQTERNSRNSRTPEQRRLTTEPKRGSAGFSFSIPSPATLAVVAGTVLLSVVALNWGGLPVPIAASSHPVEPVSDMAEAGRRLAEFSLPASAALAVSPPRMDSEPTLPVTEGEEIPLDLMETFSWTNYQVRPGDSVSKIAAMFSLSMDAIIASNNISNARRLPEGKVLKIPNMDGIPYTVKKGDSLTKISKSMGVPLSAILDANDIRSDDIKPGETIFIPGAKMAPGDLKLALGELFAYPLGSRRITSRFGWRDDPFTGARSFHAALDMAAGIGTPVKAAMDGTVSVVSVSHVYGKFIILSHDGGYQTLYAHLSSAAVRQGDHVGQGSKIGEVGNTGYSTGPHLHFGVYKNGRAVNPLDLLN
jgi:murein DD-endopeptidase MepM/ murein hydrolase activator NlpD